MRNQRSAILDNFLKIAGEDKILSDFSSEKAKKILDKTHRADSLSKDNIEKLYRTKQDIPKGNQYKRNIIEDAHPQSSIIGRSYDKLNGLVENNNERQDIILNIVNKVPTGQLTNHKYAEKELLLSLVRLGNDLDNNEKEDLRKLADTCLIQISKKAQISLFGAGLIAIPVLLGALYLQQHLSFINDGFEKNHQKLISEIDDLIQGSSSWGVGYDYKSDFKSMVQDLKTKLISFYSLYSKIAPLITDLEKPRTAKELIELAKNPHTGTIVKAYGTIKSATDNMLPYLETVEKNFASETYKARQIEDKGFMSSIVDKLQVMHGGKGLVADDFDDVVRAISPYKKSISDLMNILNGAESIKNSSQQQIEEASTKAEVPAVPLEEDAGTSLDASKNSIEELEKDLESGL